MVNILRHASASPVVDEQAMQTFRHQWEVYSKVVDNDYFSHQAGRRLPRAAVRVGSAGPRCRTPRRASPFQRPHWFVHRVLLPPLNARAQGRFQRGFEVTGLACAIGSRRKRFMSSPLPQSGTSKCWSDRDKFSVATEFENTTRFERENFSSSRTSDI